MASARFGGLTKEYHVEVDPDKLVAYQIPLATLIAAIENSNTNAGGNYLTVGEQAFNVRGIGFIRSLGDIRNIVLAANKGTPISVGNVADVSVGYAPRLGIVGMNHRDEVSTGIVLMRKYGNTLETVRGVERKVTDLNSSGIMPVGYKIVPYYDRTTLVDTTLHTVLENLTIGMVLVFLVLLFFLNNLRAAIIAAINIPLALCGAFALMHFGGTPANLISLGAIDFGIIIDTTVIVMENIHRHLAIERPGGENASGRVLRAAQEVGGPMFFSTLIFVIAFLPLFTMRGVEGAIFSPMSHTYAYALGAAIILAITLSPVLSSYLFENGLSESHNRVWDAISRFYHNLFVLVLEWPKLTLTLILIVLVAVLSQFPRLGGQFLPKLEEGNIWARATMPLTISLDHGAALSNRMRGVFLSFPEVANTVSQLGRPDDGTETTGFFNIEFSIDLKPQSQWPHGLTKPELVDQIDRKLGREFPGVSFGYSQNIEDNIDEALSGVKGTDSVKIFGTDLAVDEKVANQVLQAMSGVRGVVDLAVYRSLGQPNLLITPNRDQCARYGLNVGDVNGRDPGRDWRSDYYAGARRRPQLWSRCTLAEALPHQSRRHSADPCHRPRMVATSRSVKLPISVPPKVRHSSIAKIFSATCRCASPCAGAIFRARFRTRKRAVARHVVLPLGVHLEWAGEYQELRAANRRLEVVVPIALLLITAVLYGATTSLIDTFIIMAQIPVACLGGILGSDHYRYSVQRLGSRRFHLDFRHRRDGRHHPELLHPPALAGGPSLS